jgi:hypothetical protein
MAKYKYVHDYDINSWDEIKPEILKSIENHAKEDADYVLTEFNEVVKDKDFEGLIYHIMEYLGYGEEEKDGDFLTTVIEADITDDIRLVVSKSRYIKDGGICDSQTEEIIIVQKRVLAPVKPKTSFTKKDIKTLIEEYKKEELPRADEPFDYQAEIASGLNGFIEWLDKK